MEDKYNECSRLGYNINKRSSVTKIKYLFQGQSVISQNWLNFDTDWIEENVMTREPDLFKWIYHKHIPGQ